MEENFSNLEKVISEARDALKNGRCLFGPNVVNFVDEFMQLNINHSEEIWPLLIDLFTEIKPKYYVGCELKEPDIHATGHGNGFEDPFFESFIFSWKSKKLHSEITLKFALNADHFYFVSLQTKKIKK